MIDAHAQSREGDLLIMSDLPGRAGQLAFELAASFFTALRNTAGLRPGGDPSGQA
ncbi:hypothetical protein [Nonomuraea sp. NPDC046570]|uniref:hypothetical protein n=1 Tax=Nonomuraea sp. NPDC046570 TaxID=3155255 RepID=UPI00340DC3F6